MMHPKTPAQNISECYKCSEWWEILQVGLIPISPDTPVSSNIAQYHGTLFAPIKPNERSLV